VGTGLVKSPERELVLALANQLVTRLVKTVGLTMGLTQAMKVVWQKETWRGKQGAKATEWRRATRPRAIGEGMPTGLRRDWRGGTMQANAGV
jgi:hypothetical protein